MHLAKHLDRAGRVHQRNVLRRRHDHSAVEGDLLRERELRVAGAGRKIDD
jgi:hypothetical protein